MVTGYEVDMYRNIAAMRKALERIAAALEKLADDERFTPPTVNNGNE